MVISLGKIAIDYAKWNEKLRNETLLNEAVILTTIKGYFCNNTRNMVSDNNLNPRSFMY
jgi:hypothetical protein